MRSLECAYSLIGNEFRRKGDYQYNLAGQVERARYANGTSFAIGRDSLGRTTGITWSASSGADLPSYTYSYDLSGNVTGKNGGVYTYDALDRLTSSVETGPFLTGSKIQAEAAEGDYAGVKTLSLTEDEADVRFDSGSMSVGTYFGKNVEVRGMCIAPRDSIHRVTAEHVEVYRADASGAWAEDSAATVTIAATGAVEVSFPAGTYAYGVKAHCLWDERRIDYSADATKATFANSADEILKVTYVERERKATYSYNKAGNRTAMTEVGSIGAALDKLYGYYPDTDRVRTDGEFAYVYDANGSLVEKGNAYTLNDDGTVSFNASAGKYLRYEYDLWGRMVAVRKGARGKDSAVLVAAYTYGPEGLRVKKNTDTSTTSYVYAIDGNVHMETRVAGQTTRVRSFVYALGKLVGYDETIDGVTKRYFVATDMLGSVTAETDASGYLVGRREYQDFGEASLDYASVSGNAHESLVSFTGKEYDEDAELSYFNFRWYDEELGAFVSEDPILSGANWYTYCSGNPMNTTDHWGLVEDIGTDDDGRRIVESGAQRKERVAKQKWQRRKDIVEDEGGSVYTVKPGDKLWKIAQEKYGNSSLYDAIAGYNGIMDANQIDVGQEILLPASGTLSDPEGLAIPTVASSEPTTAPSTPSKPPKEHEGNDSSANDAFNPGFQGLKGSLYEQHTSGFYGMLNSDIYFGSYRLGTDTRWSDGNVYATDTIKAADASTEIRTPPAGDDSFKLGLTLGWEAGTGEATAGIKDYSATAASLAKVAAIKGSVNLRLFGKELRLMGAVSIGSFGIRETFGLTTSIEAAVGIGLKVGFQFINNAGGKKP